MDEEWSEMPFGSDNGKRDIYSVTLGAGVAAVNDGPTVALLNAASGEVQGQRPYSWIKITLFVLVILLTIALVGILSSQ